MGVDFESITFELYGEFAIAEDFLKGHINPLSFSNKLLGKEMKVDFFNIL